MAQSITLTASMRSNLSSLKSIQSQMDTTQERLSTGKKVNSAIDNASSYYQARSLTNRASDLDALLDSMGQGIQTIQAANEGIEAVTEFVEQLKSVATSAFALDPTSDTYATSIESYKEQFDKIQEEIRNLVKDSSYQGVNLLTGGKLTVTFNETRSNRFTVQGEDIVAGMNIRGTDTWDLTPTQVKTDQAVEISTATKIADGAEIKTVSSNSYAKAESGSWYKLNSSKNGVEGTPLTQAQFEALGSAGDGGTISGDIDIDAVTIAENSDVYTLNGADIAKGTDDNWYNISTKAQVATGSANPSGAVAKEEIPDCSESIDETINSIAAATDYLRSYATELGNNFSIIETRQNFTEALIDVLETGSDNLVLADMNEESANYLALQTRQQLAVNSLSLASQSAQSVLSLF